LNQNILPNNVPMNAEIKMNRMIETTIIVVKVDNIQLTNQ